MRRLVMLSVAVTLLIVAGFATGVHKAMGIAGVTGPDVVGKTDKMSGESCSGDAKTVRAPNPDPAMSAMCERSCAARGYDEASVVAQPKAHTGDLTRCPVSGVVFEVVKENASVPYAGKEWLTCCGSCAKKLAAAPERFLGSWISGGGQVF